jgi:23S rRNA (uracil1939-C5)-methyltransferase
MLFKSWKTIDVPDVLACPQPCFYRHKVQLPFSPLTQGAKTGCALGCYAVDSHKVIDQKECMVQERELSSVAWIIREWASVFALPAYNEKTGRGFLRHVLLRKGAGTGEILIGLVTNGERPKGTRFLAEKLLDKIEKSKKVDRGKIVGIIQNVNTRATNVVLGEREYAWWGRSFLKEKLGTFSFHVGLSSFFQVNPIQTPVLYDKVKQHVPEGSRVLDMYCGVGSITLWIADKAAVVTGIDENIVSIKTAIAASRANRIGNVRFVSGDAFSALDSRSNDNYEIVILDPPRKGLDNDTVETLRRAGLHRIIYVSCDPVSLVRDIKRIEPVFTLRSIQGIDMFPQTNHVETVAVLDRS